MPVSYRTPELEVSFAGRNGEIAFVSIKVLDRPGSPLHPQEIRIPLMLITDLVDLLTRALTAWVTELPKWALDQMLAKLKGQFGVSD